MPKLTTKEAAALVVKRTRNGRGIVAKKSFRPNATIFEVTGTKVTCNEDEDMDEVERNNAFRISKNWYISPKGRLGDMLNHSCDPNAKIVKKGQRLFVVAHNAVLKGAEVTIDYSTILASDDSWAMHCNCGAPACRKVVQKFNKLPKALQLAYRKEGVVPAFILAL